MATVSERIHLRSVVEVKGAVLPVWLVAVLFFSIVCLAAAVALLAWEVKQLTIEVNILQIQTQDVGAIMIREGLATRRDFTVGPLNEERQTPQGGDE